MDADVEPVDRSSGTSASVDLVCEGALMHRVGMWISVTVAALCATGAVIGVVSTGRDGALTDWFAVLTVAALVVAWRLHHRPSEVAAWAGRRS